MLLTHQKVVKDVVVNLKAGYYQDKYGILQTEVWYHFLSRDKTTFSEQNRLWRFLVENDILEGFERSIGIQFDVLSWIDTLARHSAIFFSGETMTATSCLSFYTPIPLRQELYSNRKRFAPYEQILSF